MGTANPLAELFVMDGQSDILCNVPVSCSEHGGIYTGDFQESKSWNLNMAYVSAVPLRIFAPPITRAKRYSLK